MVAEISEIEKTADFWSTLNTKGTATWDGVAFKVVPSDFDRFMFAAGYLLADATAEDMLVWKALVHRFGAREAFEMLLAQINTCG